MKPQFALTTVVLFSLFTITVQASGIELTVEGVRSAKGKILAVVFDNAEAYKKLDYTKAVDYAEIAARKGIVKHKFKRLTEGPYAIFLFHDENGDQDLNMERNIPTEGFGVSGTNSTEDNPSFSEASITSRSATIRVFYIQ